MRKRGKANPLYITISITITISASFLAGGALVFWRRGARNLAGVGTNKRCRGASADGSAVVRADHAGDVLLAFQLGDGRADAGLRQAKHLTDVLVAGEAALVVVQRLDDGEDYLRIGG